MAEYKIINVDSHDNEFSIEEIEVVEEIWGELMKLIYIDKVLEVRKNDKNPKKEKTA